jgi:hypothetical protein
MKQRRIIFYQTECRSHVVWVMATHELVAVSDSQLTAGNRASKLELNKTEFHINVVVQETGISIW